MAPEGVIEDEAEPKGITRALWGVWLIVLQSIYLLACGPHKPSHSIKWPIFDRIVAISCKFWN
jgi:hypothetical protein